MKKDIKKKDNKFRQKFTTFKGHIINFKRKLVIKILKVIKYVLKKLFIEFELHNYVIYGVCFMLLLSLFSYEWNWKNFLIGVAIYTLYDLLFNDAKEIASIFK